ncbi:hypothetical protein K469DRAFT_297120 [Zopfia rhizophila CBS 207.26]|uniref:Thymidylate kinase protein n=1 Tax=Zopfia rhizophila CBS 207.26 TaxID=1314779 RepID=A0A6A6DJZ5_9PEZI|nr:hypothetical protein K469DRAFT_297120 [Zopfia rhizophila CBS 207.26]
MALSTRQPFAELGSPRLQSLSSAKNRQNAITPTFSSPLKHTQSTGKRRYDASAFEEQDSENIDPSIFNSPTKRSKTGDGLSKPSQFSLLTTSPSIPSQSITASPSIPSVRKALSSTNTSVSTPISLSRGSPKHKRIGLLSKRRTSSSPFRRVDPPSFSQSSPALPFSIDAALSGTIPNYTPKSVSAPSHVSTLEESMPKSWFFDIHEDTLEQEATNLMEHSAQVLDISSDDDCETKRKNEELERGKENIPPPDFFAAPANREQAAEAMEDAEPVLDASPEHVKMPRLRKIAQDAMDEDRSPLSDLPAAEFYGPGLDATSYVTVDVTIEKPSGLSKEFDFGVATPKKEGVKEESETVDAPIVDPRAEEPIQIFADETASAEVPAVSQEEMPVVTEAVSEPVETLSEVTP